MFLVSDPTASPILTQVTLSGIMVLVLQRMKQSSWFPWITMEEDKISKAVAATLAAISAIGVSVVWTHGANPGSYTLAIDNLTWMTVLGGIWAWIKSYVVQHIIYKSTVTAAAPVDVTVQSKAASRVEVSKGAEQVEVKKEKP